MQHTSYGGFSRKGVFVSLLCLSLLLVQGLLADWSVKMISGSILPSGEFLEGRYIDGVSTKCAVKTYMTTDENGVEYVMLYMSRENDSVTWGGIDIPEKYASIVLWYKDNLSANKDSVREFRIGRAYGDCVLQPNLVDEYLGTFYYTVKPGASKVQVKGQKTIYAESTLAGEYDFSDYYDKVTLDGPSSIVSEAGFQFNVVDGYEMDEEGSLDIYPTDEQFSSVAWDGEGFSETDEVTFIYANVESGVGSVSLKEDGSLRFLPKTNLSGDIPITVTARSTNPDLERTLSVTTTVTVHVNDVDDPPELREFSTGHLDIKEGEMVKTATGRDIYFIETERDKDDANLCENARMILSADGFEDLAFDVKLVQEKPEGAGDLNSNEYFYHVVVSDSDFVIPYTAVNGRKGSSQWYTVTLEVTDGGSEGYQESLTLEDHWVSILNTDRPCVVNSVEIQGNGVEYDSATDTYRVLARADMTVVADVTDPDGDPTSYTTTYAYEDGTEATKPFQKGRTLKATIHAQSHNTVTSVATTYEMPSTILVVNTAPVVEYIESDTMEFHTGGRATGLCSFFVTDDDGVDDLVIPSSWPLDSGSGLTGEVEISSFVSATTPDLCHVTVNYTIPEDIRLSSEEYSSTCNIQIADKENAYTTFTAKINFSNNPAPVVTASPSAITVEEVDPENPDNQFTEFPIDLTVTDSGVYPAGVANWRVEYPEGWSGVVTWKEDSAHFVDSGEYEDHATLRVTLAKGYDTISNDPVTGKRPSQKDFTVKIYAEDRCSSLEGCAEVTVTVKDVDQELLVYDAYQAFEILEEDRASRDKKYFYVVPKANPMGWQDFDNDAIAGYDYKWSRSKDGGQTWTEMSGVEILSVEEGQLPGANGATFTDASHFTRSEVLKLELGAYSTPYEDKPDYKVYSYFGVEYSMDNVYPYFYHVGEEPATEPASAPAPLASNTFIWELEQGMEESAVLYVAAYDVDVADGDAKPTHNNPDNVMYYDYIWHDYNPRTNDMIVGNEFSLDLTSGKITLKLPEEYFNDGEDMPSIDLVAVDEGYFYWTQDSVEHLYIYVKVNHVNRVPVVPSSTVYVLPDQRGLAKISNITCDVGEGEESLGQKMLSGEIVSIEDPEGIFGDVTPTVEPDGTTLRVSYTVKEDAPMGASAVITFTGTDDGTSGGVEDHKTSEPATLTVYVGCTPWYPPISFECADPEKHVDGHVVLLYTEDMEEDDEPVSIRLEPGQTEVLPEDFYNAGFDGLKSEAMYAVEIYVWDSEAEAIGDLCAEEINSAPKYGLPGAATCDEDTVTTDEEGKVTLPDITIPLAGTYEMVVYDEDGKEIQKIGPVPFTPDEDGNILPVISGQELQLPDPGEYTLVVTGTNPEGSGPATQVLTIIVPDPSEKVLAWGDTPAFSPADEAVLTDGTVRFTWPVASNAEGYELRIYDEDGKLVKELTELSGNSTVVELEFPDDSATYTWTVTAYADDKSIVSDELEFTLTNDKPLKWGDTPAFSPADDEVLTDGTVRFTWPEASNAEGYELRIYDEDGKLVKELTELPDNSTEVELELPEDSAAYTWTVTAYAGDKSIDSDEHEFTLLNEKLLEWGDTPAFSPADGKVLTDGTVHFTWPVASNADGYELRIYDEDGELVEELTKLSGNSTVVELEFPEDAAASYTWTVTAYADDKSIVSEVLEFTLSNYTDKILPLGIYAEVLEDAVTTTGDLLLLTEGSVDPSIHVTFDAQYFSVPEMTWFYAFKGEAVVESKWIRIPMQGAPTAAEDYVCLRLYANGKLLGDYVVYLVQDGALLL